MQLARHLCIARLMGRRCALVEPPEGQQVADRDRGQHHPGDLEDHRQIAAQVLHIGKPEPHQKQNEVDHLAQALVDQLDQSGRGEGNQIADCQWQQDQQHIEQHRGLDHKN